MSAEQVVIVSDGAIESHLVFRLPGRSLAELCSGPLMHVGAKPWEVEPEVSPTMAAAKVIAE